MSSTKRLLILDDDPEILELLHHILGNRYILLTKTNTDDFETALEEFKPDVILIDHFIGDKTSSDVITASLRSKSNIPVILHSAHEEIEKLSIDTKVAAYIRKPSSIVEIRNSIARVLQ